MKRLKKLAGFTIIEVVLVLAVAGLIFVMVFVAWPALQRGQNDTAIKNNVATVVAAVVQYTSNSRGKFPSDYTALADYVTEVKANTEDNITVYSEAANNLTNSITTIGTREIVVIQKRKCLDSTKTSQTLETTSSGRNYAVVAKLESGGGVFYCQDN